MKPVPTSGANGSPAGSFEKTMDKDPHDYEANETVPEDDFGAEAPPDPFVKCPNDLSKTFV